MRLPQFVTLLALATSTIYAASIPESNALSLRHVENVPRSEDIIASNALEKRKGGGGKGGGGGGGGGGKSGGGGGGSSRSSPSSKTGGSTRSGSGAPRAYGGGYYGGGATVPYTAGQRTPKGLAPGFLLLPVAALAIFPGLWLWSVYPYNLRPYSFRNYTENGTNPLNETLPVTCLCQDYSVCGCDDNDDPRYLNDLIGNGSYAALNKTLVTVSMVNDTRTLVLNGTLPNGTTAPGGTDDGAAVRLGFGKYSGYWAMVMIVLYGVILL